MSRRKLLMGKKIERVMKIGNLFSRSKLLGLLIFVSFTRIASAQNDIQSLVEQLKKYDDPQKQYEVGFKTSAKILGSSPLVSNQKLTQYLNLVGKTLIKNSPGDSYAWTFAAIESDDINAFAAPGGFVFVTKGLLRSLSTEDELAAVLAHEISHVRLSHYIKVVKKQMMAEYTLKSLNENPDAQLEALASAATLVLSRGLDKQAEFDADRESVVLLAKSGYDPSAMADVLNMLDKKASDTNQSMSFLLTTHPHPKQRLQALGACCADAFSEASVKNLKTQKRFDSVIKSSL